jgi:hypothetical protein
VGRIEGGFHTQINKNTDPAGPRWQIRWLKDKSTMPNIVEEILIDGISGRIISKNKIKYFNN